MTKPEHSDKIYKSHELPDKVKEMNERIDELKQNISILREAYTELRKEGLQLKDTLKEKEKTLKEATEDLLLDNKLITLEEQLKLSEKNNEEEEKRLSRLTERTFLGKEKKVGMKEVRDATEEASKQLKRKINTKDKLSNIFEKLHNNEAILKEEIESKKNSIADLQIKKANLEQKINNMNDILRKELEVKEENQTKNEMLRAKVEELRYKLDEENKKTEYNKEILNNIKYSLYLVTNELKEEKQLYETTEKNYNFLQIAIDKYREEKFSQTEHISRLKENIAMKNNQNLIKQTEIMRWKEQVEKHVKKIIHLEREIVKLEKSKDTIEKIQERKKSTIANLQRDLVSYKKEEIERQSANNLLNKQQMIINEEIHKAKLARQNELTLIKANRKKEETLENSLKQIKQETIKINALTINSEKIKNSFCNEHMILTNEEKAANNELKILERKLSICMEKIKNKESKLKELMIMNKKNEHKRNKQINLFQDSKITLECLQKNLKTLLANKSILKEKLDLKETELNKLTLLFEKYSSDLKLKNAEYEKQTKIVEEIQNNIKIYLIMNSEVKNQIKMADKQLKDERKTLKEEQMFLKKTTNKLISTERKLREFKEKSDTESECLEYIRREETKNHDSIRFLKSELNLASLKSNIFDQKNFKILNLQTNLKQKYAELNNDRSQFIAFKSYFKNYSNETQWRVMKKKVRRKSELIQENKLIYRRIYNLKNKIARNLLQVNEKDIILDDIDDRISKNAEAVGINAKIQYTCHLLRRKTNQIKNLSIEKNMFSSLLDREKDIKMTLLEELRELQNKYIST